MAWNDVYSAPDNQPQPDTSPDLRVSLPPVYAPSLGIRPGDDTQPSPPSYLNTSWARTPPADGNGPWGYVPQDAPVQRIRGAAYDAWTGVPDVLTPGAQNAINTSLGWFGRNVVNPVIQAPGTVARGLAAGGAAAQATISELLQEAGVPASATRDLNLAAQSVPLFTAADIPTIAAKLSTPTLETAGPRYAPPPSPGAPPGGGASAADVTRVAQNQLQRGPISGPTMPTGIQGPIAPPNVPPTTADAAKIIRQQLYNAVDNNSGAAVTADYANQGLNAAIKKLMPEGPLSGSIDSSNPASKLAIDLSGARDQPITLGDYTRADQKLTGLVDNQVKPDGSLTQTGRDIQNVQYGLRDHFNAAGPDDTVGGQTGFDLLDPARKAYSQEQKMNDVNDMIRRASTLTDNPQNSIRSQVRSFLNSDASRGWSDMEKAALQDGAERGWLGTGVRIVGNQFVAPALGAWLAGPLGLLAGKGAAEAGSGFAGAIARARLSGVLPKLGESVPPPPNLLSLPAGD